MVVLKPLSMTLDLPTMDESGIASVLIMQFFEEHFKIKIFHQGAFFTLMESGS